MAADLIGFTQHGEKALITVYEALSAHAPHLTAHVDAAVTRVRLAPDRCQRGAAACAREDEKRVVFCAMHPEYLPLKETARILLHEARHWQMSADGSWYVLHHSCSEPFCRIDVERAADAVYRGDDAAMPWIVEALRRAGHNPEAPFVQPLRPPPAPAPFPWGKLAVSVMVGFGIGGGLALVAGAANNGPKRDAAGRFTS